MDKFAQVMQAEDPCSVRVSTKESLPVLSLRYLGRQAKFVAHAQSSLGCELPSTLCAYRRVSSGNDASYLLAWRGPTETLLLTETQAIIDRFAEMASTDDGCVVDLTGSFTLFSCKGRGLTELFARLGGPGSFPAPGEARPGRLAELPALALSEQSDECHILVERHYSQHLAAWLRYAMTCGLRSWSSSDEAPQDGFVGLE